MLQSVNFQGRAVLTLKSQRRYLRGCPHHHTHECTQQGSKVGQGNHGHVDAESTASSSPEFYDTEIEIIKSTGTASSKTKKSRQVGNNNRRK